jgi:hypothetical protein
MDFVYQMLAVIRCMSYIWIIAKIRKILENGLIFGLQIRELNDYPTLCSNILVRSRIVYTNPKVLFLLFILSWLLRYSKLKYRSFGKIWSGRLACQVRYLFLTYY